MTNVIKQTIYSLRKSKLFIKCCAVIFLITFASSVSGLIATDEANAETLSGSIDTFTMFTTVVIAAFAALGIGVDFKCKTIYSLVMKGTQRKEIFFGKLAAFFPYVVLMTIIQFAAICIPFLIFESNALFNDLFLSVIPKILIFIVIYYSYAVLSVAFTFISKSSFGGIGSSILVMMLYNAVSLLSNHIPKIFGHGIPEYCGMFVYRVVLTNDSDALYFTFVAVLHIVLLILYSVLGYKLFEKADLI